MMLSALLAASLVSICSATIPSIQAPRTIAIKRGNVNKLYKLCENHVEKRRNQLVYVEDETDERINSHTLDYGHRMYVRINPTTYEVLRIGTRYETYHED